MFFNILRLIFGETKTTIMLILIQVAGWAFVLYVFLSKAIKRWNEEAAQEAKERRRRINEAYAEIALINLMRESLSRNDLDSAKSYASIREEINQTKTA